MSDAQTHGDSGRTKVFVSYSRTDADFADQLVLALEDKGFSALLDRHDIDAAEKWKDRLSALIASSDTIVFILTADSAGSPICHWEVEEAVRLGKRTIPVIPQELGDVAAPSPLADLNYVHFYRNSAIPGSGFYDGVQKLERALKIDLDWLRQQTRLLERAAEWRATHAIRRPEDHLLRASALEEALAWRAKTPPGSSVPLLVSEYLDASETAEARRKAEAQANIAEREAALQQAESAIAHKAKTERFVRRAAVGASVLFAALATTAVAFAWQADQQRRNVEIQRDEARTAYQRLSEETSRRERTESERDRYNRLLNWFVRRNDLRAALTEEDNQTVEQLRAELCPT